MPWDRHAGIVSYLKTWWQVATSPGRTARGFPAVPISENARRYARISTIAAILMFVVCNLRLFWLRPESLFPTLLGFTIGSIFAYETCESLLAELLSNVARPPHQRDPTAYWFWQGLLQYLGGFKPLLVACACVGLQVFGGPRTSSVAPHLLTASWLLSIAVVGWWFAAVVTMARQWEQGAAIVAKSVACVAGTALVAGVVFWLLGAISAALGFAVAALLEGL